MPYPIRLLMNLVVAPVIIGIFIVKLTLETFQQSYVSMMDYKDLQKHLKLTEREFDPSLVMVAETRDTALGLIDAGDWGALDGLIKRLDETRAKTPDGTRLTPVVQAAAWMYLLDGVKMQSDDCGDFPEKPIGYERIEPFVLAARGMPESYALNGLAGWLCLKVGWGRRGGDYAAFTPDQAFVEMAELFNIADGFLDRFDAAELSSPFLAGIAYERLAGISTTLPKLNAAFEQRLALDPGDYSVMSEHAFHLLPRWYGDYDILDAKAREVMAATHLDLGSAAYAAFYLSQLNEDEGAMATVDVALLRDGLHDMIRNATDEQAAVNAILGQLSEAGANVMGLGRTPSAIKQRRKMFRKLFAEILREHLVETTPSRWPFGKRGILFAVAEVFNKEIMDGKTVTLGPDGVQFDAGPA